MNLLEQIQLRMARMQWHMKQISNELNEINELINEYHIQIQHIKEKLGYDKQP